MPSAIRGRARGVTLLELLVVLMILSIILTAAVKTWDATLERGRAETTWRKLNQLVGAMVGDPDYIVAGQRADFGFVGDIGRLPNKLQELVVSPVISESSRWRGPYLRSTFNESPDAFRIDGWGDTIIYGRDQYGLNNDSLWVRSYGGRAYLDRARWQTVYLPYIWSDLTNNTISGQVVDVRGDLPTKLTDPEKRSLIVTSIKVILYQPIEGVLQENNRAGPDVFPTFTFSAVPQGTHRLEAMYVNYYTHIPAETLTTVQYVPVYPGIGARDITMRINVDWDDEAASLP